jgi:hypothetical protein
LDHTLCLGEQAAAVGEQRLAGRCEFDAAARPLEQGDPELLLEPSNLVTQ